MITLDGKKVVGIEFAHEPENTEYPWQPFSIFTPYDSGNGYDEYNMDYCKGDDVFAYHLSGGSPNISVYPREGSYYWFNPSCQGHITKSGSNGDESIDIETVSKPLPISEEQLQEIFSHAWEGHTEYCSKCDDRIFVDSWGTNQPCKHIRWCDPCGGWSTPSEDEYHHRLEGEPRKLRRVGRGKRKRQGTTYVLARRAAKHKEDYY